LDEVRAGRDEGEEEKEGEEEEEEEEEEGCTLSTSHTMSCP